MTSKRLAAIAICAASVALCFGTASAVGVEYLVSTDVPLVDGGFIKITPIAGSLPPSYEVLLSSGDCNTAVRTSNFVVDPVLAKGLLLETTNCGLANITWYGIGNSNCTDTFSPAGIPNGQIFTRTAVASGHIGTRAVGGVGQYLIRWQLTGLP